MVGFQPGITEQNPDGISQNSGKYPSPWNITCSQIVRNLHTQILSTQATQGIYFYTRIFSYFNHGNFGKTLGDIKHISNLHKLHKEFISTQEYSVID